MVRLSGCCCCCSLRTGTIIIAILTFLAAVFYLALGGWLLSGEMMKRIKEIEKKNQKTTITEEEWKTFADILGATLVVVGTIVFIIFVCLAIGINKSRSKCIGPWLICYMLALVANVVQIIYVVASRGQWEALVGFVGVAFGLYLWMVVYSFYKEVQETETVNRMA